MVNGARALCNSKGKPSAKPRGETIYHLLFTIHLFLSFNPASAAQRGSVPPRSQEHSPAFKSAPHFAQRPLHSSRQSRREGSASTICSRTSSSKSTASPS